MDIPKRNDVHETPPQVGRSVPSMSKKTILYQSSDCSGPVYSLQYVVRIACSTFRTSGFRGDCVAEMGLGCAKGIALCRRFFRYSFLGTVFREFKHEH